ncbi:MAG: type II asparaginase [Sphingobacteriia bacterium]|nr:MAG: type II asparaginase [Sphingobacteriia bacterium]
MKKILFLFLAAAISLQVQAQNKPRVIILATGGTIAGEGSSADRAGYTSGKIPIESLIGGIPQVKKFADITGEQVASVGSQDMSVAIWGKLIARINEIVAKKEADGIVITHGTDTQEETGYFLDLLVKSKIPVVLTGSMRPATAISADGPKNLFDAIVVAAAKESWGRGVLVSFNESIFDARDVVKVSTTKVNAFASPNTGPLGQVYDGKVEYYTQNIREENTDLPFVFGAGAKVPKVEVVYMYADADASPIKNFADKGVDGLIIAGVGNGNFSKAFYDAIDYAVKKGVVVVRSSRIVSGRVTLEDEIDDTKLGTLVSDDLNPAKARVLLMLGLMKTKDKKKLQEYFFTY